MSRRVHLTVLQVQASPDNTNAARKYGAHLTRVITSEKFDCQACAACCAPFSDAPAMDVQAGWADCTPQDLLRLTRKEFTRDVVVAGPIGPQIRTVDHRTDGVRCVKLTGRIGVKAGCSIYERRPLTCSAFTMGSRACLNARAARGLE